MHIEQTLTQMRNLRLSHMAKAMEGALHYQQKDFAAMRKSFDNAIVAGKKEPLMWAVYAWCLVQSGDKTQALQVLGRGVETNPTDEKLKGSLSALQNDKRLKMKPYEPMWWQFGLESPPPQMMGGGGGAPGVFSASTTGTTCAAA